MDTQMVDRLNEYLNSGFNSVKGWCDPRIWNVIDPIEVAQRKDGVDAGVCEIGVHHGKFFIGLANTVQTTKKSLAIDVFDLQHFNIDSSGKGSLEKFLHNVSLYADPDSVETMTADSLTLGIPEILSIYNTYGRFAYFSIDGGHTAEHTINDMLVAMQLTLPSGLIFVDDYYNANWPGVQEGVVALYAHQSPNFIPLCVANRKLILGHISYHEQYMELIENHITANYSDIKPIRQKRMGRSCLTIKGSR